jgi:seryl-tRNA synthetase
MSRWEQKTLIDSVRSLEIEVQSYKADNERLMREQNQINAKVQQSLNRFHGKVRKGSNLR